MKPLLHLSDLRVGNCLLLVVCLLAPPALANGLDRTEAARERDQLAALRVAALRDERAAETEARALTIGQHCLRWTESTYGKAGKNGWPLWISLHGGGEVPPSVNENQWRAQATLYRPENGIYLAPRAPTDSWNLWHEPHIDALLERLIEDMIVVRGVDPNRIYLLGYSAGGNGVYHLAPRMADRFAAAASMAGYPSGAPQLSLRNLPFAILVGGHDTTFDRVKEAESWKARFGTLHAEDSEGYQSFHRVYTDFGHWMQGKDAEAVPWMAAFERNPWPKKIVWVQDETIRPRFYWLEVPVSETKASAEVRASVTGQTISVTGDLKSTVTLWLSDSLVDLDQPVLVQVNGNTLYHAPVARTREAIQVSLVARPDRAACATAVLKLSLKPLPSS